MSYEKDFFSINLLKQITPKIPLEISSEEPGYKMISEKNIKEAIELDLKSILLTQKGERFDTSFGVGLKKYLFENADNLLVSELNIEIRSQISRYMPWLSSYNVQVKAFQEQQSLFVRVKYKINQPEIIDYFELSLTLSDL